MRLDKNVDVIGHYGIRVNPKHFLMVSSFQCGDDAFGDAGNCQPKRTGSRGIQIAVVVAELLAGGVFFFGNLETGWKGTV